MTKTAFYSPEFARRVVHHMLRDGSLSPGKDCQATRQRQHQEVQDVRWSECRCFRFQEWAPGLLCPHCLGFEVASKGSEQANTVSETSRERPFTVQERERVMRQLHHLHRTTGHGSYESLLKSLEKRRADPRVLELARNFRCNTCEERKRPQPRRLANLEVSTDRCKIIQMDAAHWTPSPLPQEQVSVFGCC